ncbi:D-isomer specific 2-hydroxyacid dehydrogenase [Xylaria arbuscula]|nr:D-isomer specific 2-hydroxyacid dehydrogenase [Xylaria arbuscula]
METPMLLPVEPLREPVQQPSSTHEVIVSLDEEHFPLDDYNIGALTRTYEIIKYQRTQNWGLVRERIKYASIVIATRSFIGLRELDRAPFLKCIITPTCGINHISLKDCQSRGIKVLNCYGSTSVAAAEHALSLVGRFAKIDDWMLISAKYFAARRKIVLMQNMMVIKVKEDMIGWELAGDASSMMRTANGRRPPCLSDEKVGIIGDGLIGKSLARLCGGLNMTVMIAGKKSGERLRTPFRTPFDVVMRTATVLFICCAANRLSPSLIDADEFSVMRREAIIVNVSRASVVNTKELIKALREDRISGAATDVFDKEPVSNTRHSLMVELHSEKLNLIISPHVGHYSTGTLAEQRKMVNERIQYFVGGDVGEVEEAEVTDYDEGCCYSGCE